MDSQTSRMRSVGAHHATRDEDTEETLLKAGALQRAVFNRVTFSDEFMETIDHAFDTSKARRSNRRENA